jgi:hypothetical protein
MLNIKNTYKMLFVWDFIMWLSAHDCALLTYQQNYILLLGYELDVPKVH